MLAVSKKFNISNEILRIIYKYDNHKSDYDKVIQQLNEGCHYMEGYVNSIRRHWLSPIHDLVHIIYVQDIYRPQGILLKSNDLENTSNLPYRLNKDVHLKDNFKIPLTRLYILRWYADNDLPIPHLELEEGYKTISTKRYTSVLYPYGSFSAPK